MFLGIMNKKALIIVNNANTSKVNASNDKKFWNFSPGQTEEEVELSIYGEIVSSYSWWDSSGEVASNEFIKELENYKDKSTITVRINSNGGDFFAATAIYTRLVDMNAEIKIKIDGMCMSAATIIAMAGTCEMSPVGMFMTHGPLAGMCGYYNMEDLQEYINMLEKIKNIIINAYAKKTCKTKDELKQFVDSENYMTADEALENGFIDKIMFVDEESDDNNPVIDKNMLIINKVSTDLSKIPDEFKNKFKNIIKNKSKNSPKEPVNTGNEGFFLNKKFNLGDDEMIKNTKELQEKYPEVYQEVVNSAKEAERERIKAIDALPGDETIKNKAKFDSIVDAGQCAMQILNAQKTLGTDYLKNREDDVTNSGLDDVKASAANKDDISSDGFNYTETNAILDRALGKGGVR